MLARSAAGRQRKGIGGAAMMKVPPSGMACSCFCSSTGLRTGFPGVRHDLAGRFVVAFDLAPAEIDAGRHDQAVIGEGLAAGQRDQPLASVDADDTVDHTLTPCLSRRAL